MECSYGSPWGSPQRTRTWDLGEDSPGLNQLRQPLGLLLVPVEQEKEIQIQNTKEGIKQN